MPTRTSRPATAATADARRATAYHAAAITMLWVIVLFMSIGVWLVMLVNMLRIDMLEKRVAFLSQQVSMNRLQPVETPIIPPAPVVPSPNTTTPGALPLPSAPSAGTASPSGLLDRGTFSPDGTKFVGYDSVTRGKIGIAVEIVATKQVKHVVIFNPNSESTGKGTPQESELSVRWKDGSTIEYDYLVKQGGSWVKKTETVKIYF